MPLNWKHNPGVTDLSDVTRPEIPAKAIELAVEVNSDPSTRNLRVAVLVGSEKARQAIMEVAAGAVGSGAALRIFTRMADAETWLAKSMEQIV